MAEENVVVSTPSIGVVVKGTEQVVQERAREANALLEAEHSALALDSLYSHIMMKYQEHKDQKEDSGINNQLLDSLRQYNGEYDSADLRVIEEEGGSRIFMNLTATKVRAAISWIKDILLAEKGEIFAITPTPDIQLPEDIEKAIDAKVRQEFAQMQQEVQQQTPEGQPVPQQDMAATLKETNERKRDLRDAIEEEITKEAEYAFKIYEKKIEDQLKEGEWDKAFDEVIDDFCIFPTAIMKGPVVTKKPCLTWENGEVVVKEEYVLLNKRISPFDVYPAPEAESPQDGDFIEYMKLSRTEVANLMGTKGYKAERVRRVLESDVSTGLGTLVDSHVEQERAEAEAKDNAFEANKNVYHALHYFGAVPVKTLRSWDLVEGIEDKDDEDMVEVEAILISSEVVKCILNKDPLKRRPYYTASFQRRPGSFWGHSIPYLMRDIQKMCNATARALSNNMGLSSGPIMELYKDRLADGQDVEELRPRDIVQVTSDPMGSSGRAIQFFNVPSNASELLAVYKEYEQRADDVTMIPRYAYGNERTGGASATASGMSMLLESASKGIKDAIRHIDTGIIIPRIEAEFYYLMLKDKDAEFSGDIKVIAKGSQALTMRGAEQMRRNEFLQVTANPIDQEIMGLQGRAQILRKMADDLGLGENIVPNRQELKKVQKIKEQQAAQQQQQSDAMAITEIQMQAQMQVAQLNAQLEQAKIELKRQKDIADVQLKAQEIEQKREAAATKATADIQKQDMKSQAEAASDNKQIALSLETGDKMNK